MEILKNNNFCDKINDNSVLVDFFASWCGPCKMMNPIIEKFAEENKEKVKFYKVDVDESSDIASKFGIMSVPTFVFFRNGKEVSREVGSINDSLLEKLINS